MATLTPVGYTPLSNQYGSTTAGQPGSGVAANVAGDTIPLLGSYIFIDFRTTGTAAVVTLDSVALSNFGQDQNITVTLAATDLQDVCIFCDTRFAQTSGNVGNLNLTYSSVTGLFVDVKYLR